MVGWFSLFLDSSMSLCNFFLSTKKSHPNPETFKPDSDNCPGNLVVQKDFEKPTIGKIILLPPHQECDTVFSSWKKMIERVMTGFREGKRLVQVYLALTKYKLSGLVVSTVMFGYYMAPSMGKEFSPNGEFFWSTIGTALAIGSANALNQVIESKSDSNMLRTTNRPLPSGDITSGHALLFSVCIGSLSFLLLFKKVNFVSASLAVGNIFLYTLVYTPLKRMHPVNTWVGSVVGAIPPLIGWTSRTGSMEEGAMLLVGLLYIWQIPHFLSLSWRLKNDYVKGGYRMLCNVEPQQVGPTSLRYSVGLAFFPPLMAFCQLTKNPICFCTCSSLLNAYFIWKAFAFYKENTNQRALDFFLGSIYYLPAMMMLIVLNKQNRVFPQPSTIITFFNRIHFH